MSVLALEPRLLASGWSLQRALPRDAGHALLEVTDPAGATHPGQWFAEPGRADRVREQTSASAATATVVSPLPGVVVQPGGADRRLPGLAARCAAPGARLRAHRPERRAVVESPGDDGPTFRKLVRPGRLTPALVRATSLRIDGVPTPRVLAVDEAGSAITTAGLPGPTLHELLAAGAAGRDLLAETGRLLRRLHDAPPPTDAATHDAAAEVAVVDRWWTLARAHDAAPGLDDAVRRARHVLARDLADVPSQRALLHRDLHDKQLVIGAAGPALLDLDLLAVGDPALDLANLVVHLELRARQGLLEGDHCRELAAALVDGYAPDARTRHAVGAYLLAARLRLVAVYAFRPPSRAAAQRLLTHPLIEEIA